MMTVRMITVWETSDGEKHPSQEAANAYVLNNDLRDALADVLGDCHYDAQDILNFLSGRSKHVREWLEANDAAMKKVME